MKVLIVTPCGLPIPAVKGGAVLTLIESIIQNNEIFQKMELSVVGIYDIEAKKKAENNYPNTEFIFIRKHRIARTLDDIYEKIYTLLTGKVHKITKRYFYKLYVLRNLSLLLLKNDYDCVVFENVGYLLKTLNSSKISKKYAGKVFYHLHNDLPTNIDRKCLNQCRMMLISEYLWRTNQQLSKLPVSILKNGIDYEKFSQKLDEQEAVAIRNRLGVAGKKIVLFVGRIDPTKGIEELTEAIKIMNREDLVLLIVGSHDFGSGGTSPFEQKMKNMFSNMPDKVVFTGYIPYSDIWKYYKLANVAVLPSIWEEPAGLTMIEAAASGVPVITTISGGIPEYLSDKFSILLDRDNLIVNNIQKAIEEVIDDEGKWVVKAKQASAMIKKNYNHKIFYDEFVSIIKKEQKESQKGA